MLRLSSIHQASAIDRRTRARNAATAATMPSVAALVKRFASSRASTLASSTSLRSSVDRSAPSSPKSSPSDGSGESSRAHWPQVRGRRPGRGHDMADAAAGVEGGDSARRELRLAVLAVADHGRGGTGETPDDEPGTDRQTQEGPRVLPAEAREVVGDALDTTSGVEAVGEVGGVLPHRLGDVGHVAGLVGSAVDQRVDLARQVAQAARCLGGPLVGLAAEVGQCSLRRSSELGAGVADDSGGLCRCLAGDAGGGGLDAARLVVRVGHRRCRRVRVDGAVVDGVEGIAILSGDGSHGFVRRAPAGCRRRAPTRRRVPETAHPPTVERFTRLGEFRL